MKRSVQAVLAVAALARAGPILFGFEHYGDAPVRIEIAERWAKEPHLWHGFAETYQYGPLQMLKQSYQSHLQVLPSPPQTPHWSYCAPP